MKEQLCPYDVPVIRTRYLSEFVCEYVLSIGRLDLVFFISSELDKNESFFLPFISSLPTYPVTNFIQN